VKVTRASSVCVLRVRCGAHLVAQLGVECG
jgi:hypothetical protein